MTDAPSPAAGTAPATHQWALVVLLALIVLAPLPFGGTRPWSWTIFALAGGALLALMAWPSVRDGRNFALPIERIGWAAAGFGIVAAWIVFQMVPFVPEEWRHPSWALAEAALAARLGGTVSADPYATATALMRLLGYAGVFWAALQLARAPEIAEKLVLTVVAAGLVYGLYGLVMQFSGTDLVLWFEFKRQGNLTGTFLNRNSFATYMGLCFLGASALMIRYLDAVWVPRSPLSFNLQRIVLLARANTALPFAAALVSITALFLTHSRGGILATFLGLAAMVSAVTLLGNRRRRSGRWAGFAVTAAILAFAVTMSGGGVLERVKTLSPEGEERVEVYKQTIRAIADAPILGVGYGAYEWGYQTYRLPNVERYYTRAHNDYLEIALELGIPAAFVFAGVLAFLGLQCLRGVINRRRNTTYAAIGFGAFILVALHATVDFSLQIPAVAITFLALLGVGVAQSFPTRDTRA